MHPPNDDLCPIKRLAPYKNNARTHSKKQIKQIAESIKRFGFCNPGLISDDNTIIAGHGRVEAAKLIGMADVPVRKLSHLSHDEVRAYILADNKLAENAGWDRDLPAIEMQGLMDLDFDIEDLGFTTAEIDLTIASNQSGSSVSNDRLDMVEPVASGPAVTQSDDLWLLGQHRLLCGDARSQDDVGRLCGDRPASLLFTDPPYNVPIDGHVSGLGTIKHREFAFASGEPEKALPHPDDIKVLPGKGFIIAGPTDETELKIVKEYCALRDVLILQSVLEERIREPAVIASTENPEEPFVGALAMVLAHIINNSLPERFQKSETLLANDLMHHNRWTKLELLRETHRAWTAIGRPKPRGWILPPYQQSLVRIEQYLSLCADLLKLAQDGKLNTDREIEAELQNRIS